VVQSQNPGGQSQNPGLKEFMQLRACFNANSWSKNRPNGHWECLIPGVIRDPVSSAEGVKVFVFSSAKSLLSPPPYKREVFNSAK